MNASKLVLSLILFAGVFGGVSKAAEPGWTWQVVTFGDKREQIQNTPIIHRSYRPLHFYGNTVRRMYYHGTAIPTPRVVAEKIGRN